MGGVIHTCNHHEDYALWELPDYLLGVLDAAPRSGCAVFDHLEGALLNDFAVHRQDVADRTAEVSCLVSVCLALPGCVQALLADVLEIVDERVCYALHLLLDVVVDFLHRCELFDWHLLKLSYFVRISPLLRFFVSMVYLFHRNKTGEHAA